MEYLILVIAIIILTFIISHREHKCPTTSKYLIKSSKISKDFHDISFVVLADLHNNSFGTKNTKLIKEIDELSPDYILIAGDMIVRKKDCYPSEAFFLLKDLAKKYKIYYGYGNHERYAMEKSSINFVKYKNLLEDVGVVFLDNQTITINKNKSIINITGFNLELDYFKPSKYSSLTTKHLNSLVTQSQKNHYHIVLGHNPDYFNQYIDWGADLTLSGHLHGGIVRLPYLGGMISTRGKLFPKYDAGMFSDGKSKMIVSRGLGSHTIKLRLFNKTQLIYFKLQA